MNKMTVNEAGLNPKVEMLRQYGKWYVVISFPRWVLNDLERECGGAVTLVQASSGIVGGSELTDDARIVLVTKEPEPARAEQ